MGYQGDEMSLQLRGALLAAALLAVSCSAVQPKPVCTDEDGKPNESLAFKRDDGSWGCIAAGRAHGSGPPQTAPN